MPIIDHICITVSDYARAKTFYTKALAPLGIELAMEFGKAGGFGREGKPDLWIGSDRMDFISEEQHRVNTPIHIALTARSRKEVDAFYEAALAAGAKCHGKPGLRPEYHENYYGAFVLDLDGHNLEAVCHSAE